MHLAPISLVERVGSLLCCAASFLIVGGTFEKVVCLVVRRSFQGARVTRGMYAMGLSSRSADM